MGPASGTTAGSWGSVDFSDSSVDAVLDANEDYTSGSVMEYCLLKYGGGGGSSGVIKIVSANPLIDNCQITDGASSGLYAIAVTSLVVRNCQILRNIKVGT